MTPRPGPGRGSIRTALGRLVRSTGTQVACYRIYSLDLKEEREDAGAAPPGCRAQVVTAADVARAADESIRRLSGYGGEDALGFGIFRGGDLVCVQWIWHGRRYRTQRNFWPLADGEAKSVQVFTVPAERGRGLATFLKRYSATQLQALGFLRLYSRIWWNHHPSIRVSERAGWRHVATVLEVRLPASSRPWRLVRRKT